MQGDKKGAAVKFPPPLIYLLSTLLTFGVHRLYPLGIGHPHPVRIVGIALMVAGLGVLLWISLLFRRAQTSIEPWRPTHTIITSGIFAWSRNPVYVTLSGMQIGAGLFLNSLWVLFGSVISLLAVYLIAVRKEEIYLEQKFGEEYLRYKKTVRRWL
jgi:protein-S-isoprenylcysteine O-methyltransferase Ste14